MASGILVMITGCGTVLSAVLNWKSIDNTREVMQIHHLYIDTSLSTQCTDPSV